jgi:phosphoribosylglycinamide formyltransferase-1
MFRVEVKKMKKLAIMGSGNGSNFEAIAQYFKGKDVQITCLSNVEDAFILERAEKFGIKNEFLPFGKNLEYFLQNKFDLIVLAGYMRILPDNVLEAMQKVINIHPSLLPAFKGSANAIQEAFLAGVKVSGVTVHWVTSDVDGGAIIAQYPVFITNEMHFDEFEVEMHGVEHKLYPIVIEKLLEAKIFDFSDLMKSNCGGGCGGCKH